VPREVGNDLIHLLNLAVHVAEHAKPGHCNEMLDVPTAKGSIQAIVQGMNKTKSQERNVLVGVVSQWKAWRSARDKNEQHLEELGQAPGLTPV